MATLTNLPAELRQRILQYVLYSSVTTLERPDVDRTNLLHWCRCKPVHETTAPAYLHREEHPMSQFIPYMLVSKTFCEDVRCVWAHSDPPKLFPVLSISLVGFDYNRPMKGALLKWLTPRSAVFDVDRIEWRFHCHDQIFNDNRGYSPLIREPKPYYDFTLTSILASILSADWFGIRPYLPENSSNSGNNWGYWVFKLSTEVDTDVHLTSSEYFANEDPDLKFLPHPFREARKLKPFIETVIEYDLATGCDIWVDETLVYRLTGRRKEDSIGFNQTGPIILVPGGGVNEVICEEFDYVMDIDPLVVPRPDP